MTVTAADLAQHADIRANYATAGEQGFGNGAFVYTGVAPTTGPTACSRAVTRVVHGTTVYNCDEQTAYREIRALDKATLAFPAITETLTTSASPLETGDVPSYATSALTISPKTWNAGNDDLPGPQ